MPTSDDIRCDTCGHKGPAGQTAVWHPFQHAVNVNGSISPSQTFGKTTPERIGGSAHPAIPQDATVTVQTMPFDPVLRQALIDKGVLTPEDLRAAEEKIRAVTAQFQQEVFNE